MGLQHLNAGGLEALPRNLEGTEWCRVLKLWWWLFKGGCKDGFNMKVTCRLKWNVPLMLLCDEQGQECRQPFSDLTLWPCQRLLDCCFLLEMRMVEQELALNLPGLCWLKGLFFLSSCLWCFGGVMSGAEWLLWCCARQNCCAGMGGVSEPPGRISSVGNPRLYTCEDAQQNPFKCCVFLVGLPWSPLKFRMVITLSFSVRMFLPVGLELGTLKVLGVGKSSGGFCFFCLCAWEPLPKLPGAAVSYRRGDLVVVMYFL